MYLRTKQCKGMGYFSLIAVHNYRSLYLLTKQCNGMGYFSLIFTVRVQRGDEDSALKIKNKTEQDLATIRTVSRYIFTIMDNVFSTL